MNNKLGQGSAFPYTYSYLKDYHSCVEVKPGISKRLYLAAMAMQGILSGKYSNSIVNSPTNDFMDGFPEPISICEQSLAFTDKLLKQEAEE